MAVRFSTVEFRKEREADEQGFDNCEPDDEPLREKSILHGVPPVFSSVVDHALH
jgi:hypothetical protein